MPSLAILFAVTSFFVCLGILGPLESRLEDFYGGPQNAGQNKFWHQILFHIVNDHSTEVIATNEIKGDQSFWMRFVLLGYFVRSSGFSHCYNWNSLEKAKFFKWSIFSIVPPKLLGAIMGCCIKLSVVPFDKVCQLLCGDCSYGYPGINSHHPGRGLSS